MLNLLTGNFIPLSSQKLGRPPVAPTRFCTVFYCRGDRRSPCFHPERSGITSAACLTRCFIALVFISILTSCGEPKASDQDLEAMCNKLSALRGDSDIKTDLKKCIADAKKEGITTRQAKCRISAVNTSEYWVRCRTGAAQQHQ